MTIAPHQIYQSMMLEIKLRIRAVDECLNENQGLLPALKVEYCFLQFRKIIEQISFASIVCNHERYKDFRALEGETSNIDDGDYSKDWNASVILKTLNNINPIFMPRPIGNIESKGNAHHFTQSDLNATHTKLISMYKKCNSFLHIPKPFGEEYVTHIENQRQKYMSSKNTIISYVSYIKALIWHHAAIGFEYNPTQDKLTSVEIAGPKSAWIINFGELNNDNIELVVGVAE